MSTVPAPVQASAWNIANAVTVLRIAMVPAFVWLLLADDGADGGLRAVAALIFVLAAVTDRLDGALARHYGLVTDFGKIADPIADKALVGGAFITLSFLADLPWWLTGIVVVREVGVTALRFWVIRHGVIPASRGGKLKTTLQIAALFIVLLPLPDAWAPLQHVVMGLAVLVTVVTGLDYVLRAVTLRARGRS